MPLGCSWNCGEWDWKRYDQLKGLDWSWLSMDGALTKSPLGGGKTGPNPTDRGKGGVKRSRLTEAQGHSGGSGGGRGQPS